MRRFLVNKNGLPLRGASHRSTTHAREEALVKRALRGLRVTLRAACVGMKFWPHAARTFAVNTNARRCGHRLKRNSVPLRVFGHRGVAVFPRAVRDQRDVHNTVTERVMFLSYVPETSGGVYVLTQDGRVRDLLDRDVTWYAEFVYKRLVDDNGLQEIEEG